MISYSGIYKEQHFRRFIKYQATFDVLHTDNQIHPNFQDVSKNIIGRPAVWVRLDNRSFKQLTISYDELLHRLKIAQSFSDVLRIYLNDTEAT